MDGSERKFNIFTTNVGILKSSLYAKIPKVSVSAAASGRSTTTRPASPRMMLQNAIDAGHRRAGVRLRSGDAGCGRGPAGPRPGLRVAAAGDRDRGADPRRAVGHRDGRATTQEAATYEEVSRQEVDDRPRVLGGLPVLALPHVGRAPLGRPSRATWTRTRWSSGSAKTSASRSRSTTTRAAHDGHQQQPAAERRAAEGDHLRDLGPRRSAR